MTVELEKLNVLCLLCADPEWVAHYAEKTASTAGLLRHLASLAKAGKPVNRSLVDRLAKKTQSTAGRQGQRLDNTLPFGKDPDWDDTWGRTGRSLMDLDRRRDKAMAHSKPIPRHPGLLDGTLKAQSDLRSTGIDIGRHKRTIAPTSNPTPSAFDSLATLHPPIQRDLKQPISLTEIQFPGLQNIATPTPPASPGPPSTPALILPPGSSQFPTTPTVLPR